MTVYVHGIYDEYNGLYSALIPLQFDEENVYIYNNEPIFINENGNKCIWKQVSGLWIGWIVNAAWIGDRWWIGNCNEIGQIGQKNWTNWTKSRVCLHGL